MMSEAVTEAIKRARERRYKKPLNKEMNIESIKSWLLDISEECSLIQWHWKDDEDGLMGEILGGDGNEEEIRFMFSDLANQCEQMLDDMSECDVPEMFDYLFAFSGEQKDVFGYDSYEQDYFGLENSWEEEQAQEIAANAIKRLTKDEILSLTRKCFRISHNYLALRARYDDLSAAVNIAMKQNLAEMKLIQSINESYERANAETSGFSVLYRCDEYVKFSSFVDSIPSHSEIWIQ